MRQLYIGNVSDLTFLNQKTKIMKNVILCMGIKCLGGDRIVTACHRSGGNLIVEIGTTLKLRNDRIYFIAGRNFSTRFIA
jgi:hypothetical protein